MTFSVPFTIKYPLVAPEHDRQPPYVDVGAAHNALPARVLDGDEDGRAVRRVAQPAFMRGDALIDRVRVCAIGESHYDICVLEPEAWVDI